MVGHFVSCLCHFEFMDLIKPASGMKYCNCSTVNCFTHCHGCRSFHGSPEFPGHVVFGFWQVVLQRDGFQEKSFTFDHAFGFLTASLDIFSIFGKRDMTEINCTQLSSLELLMCTQDPARSQSNMSIYYETEKSCQLGFNTAS